MAVWIARPLPDRALSKEGIYIGLEFTRFPRWEVTIRVGTSAVVQ